MALLVLTNKPKLVAAILCSQLNVTMLLLQMLQNTLG